MTDYKPKSEFLRTIMERGFFHQCTDLEALDARLMRGDPVSAYIGFDATADSLHVGSLMQIMMLRWLQKCGHRPIVLMGGGTTKVGDPSGKDETRKLLDNEAIDNNINGIRAIFDKYIAFGNGATDAIQPNNADWLDELNYVEFLRDIGRHFTINRMMTMDSVKTRLDREQPLTFLEFNYMLLQSYDFLQLHEREGCELQIGGSDQWGNIVNGVDLTRRVADAQVFGLTSPLLTKADGSKMGKTASGAIWLNKEKLHPSEFWQFWRNTMDEDVGKFLKLFTELPVDECDRLGALQGEELNEAKEKLADAVRTLCHGSDATELPVFPFKNPTDIVKILTGIGFAKSGKEAKRMITSGSVRINTTVITEPYIAISKDDSGKTKIIEPKDDLVGSGKSINETVSDLPPTLLDDETGVIKISAGKKRHAIIEFHN